MNDNLHSPLDIENILKAYYLDRYDPFENNTIANESSVKKLHSKGFLKAWKGTEKGVLNCAAPLPVYFMLSEKGEAFVNTILNTPYPVDTSS
jgi:hypothetical protein